MRRGGSAYDGHPVAGDLDQPELGDVARDRRLGRAEAALAERGGELLLGADRALLDQVADRPLAELLHDLHRGPPLAPGEPDDEDDRRDDDAVDHEDVERARPQVAEHEAIASSPDTNAATSPTTSGPTATVDAGLARRELARLEQGRAGRDRRRHEEAKRAAASRSRPANRPAEIEMPERLMPGISASAWATPIPNATGKVTSSTPFVRGPNRSASHRIAAPIDERDRDERTSRWPRRRRRPDLLDRRR